MNVGDASQVTEKYFARNQQRARHFHKNVIDAASALVTRAKSSPRIRRSFWGQQKRGRP
jgi:hypothetical protein